MAALLASYYQAAPLLVALVGPPALWGLARSSNRRQTLGRALILSVVLVFLDLPDHVRAAIFQFTGQLFRTVGYGNPGFPSPREALGTVLTPGAIDLARGPQGSVALSPGLPPDAVLAVTILGLGLAAGGLLATDKAGTLRPLALGLGLALAALYGMNYPYGFNKAQAMAAFLPASAVALGARDLSRLVKPLVPVIAASCLAITGLAGANLVVAESPFWLPSQNDWAPAIWEGAGLSGAVPVNTPVRLSPFLQAGREITAMTAYFLRNQKMVGAYSQEGLGGGWGMGGSLVLLPKSRSARQAAPEVEVLDQSEISAFRGFLPQDLIWSDELVAAYRHPNPGPDQILIDGSGGRTSSLPAELPVTMRPALRSGPAGGSLLATFSVQQGTTGVLVTWNGGQRLLTLSPGLDVRSLPADAEGTTLTLQGGRAVLMAVAYRPGAPDSGLAEDYPHSAAVVASTTVGKSIVTRLAYFDAAIPGGASLDIYGSNLTDHPGWFHLPTVEDGYLRQMEVDLDPATLSPRIISNGEEVKDSFTSPAKEGRSLPDGEYVAYLTVIAGSGSSEPRRIPLYRYRLQDGSVMDFEQFPLSLAWAGPGQDQPQVMANHK